MRDTITVAYELFSSLKVASWVSAGADCPMCYRITGTDGMAFIFGRGTEEFELALDVSALHNLVQLGAEALGEMGVQLLAEPE